MIIEVYYISSNLITGLQNSLYDTLVVSGTEVISAIGTGVGVLDSTNAFAVTIGESIIVLLFLTLNSGEVPVAELYSATLSANCTNQVSLTAGWNTITLTASATVSDAKFVLFNANDTDYKTSEIYVIR
jgi:hypothetical protein